VPGARPQVSNTKNLETLISFRNSHYYLHWHDVQRRSSLKAPVLFLVLSGSPGLGLSRGGRGGSRRAGRQAGSTPGLPVAAVDVVPAVISETIG
jgi:hypothetical protein